MRRHKTSNPVRTYVATRIEWLQEERAKNADSTAHMILDKTIDELHIILDLIDRKAPLL